jgi:hypothetical protein
MYCEQKGTFRYYDHENDRYDPNKTVEMVVSSKFHHNPCTICVFSSSIEYPISGCGEHHCANYGWIPNISSEVDEFAAEKGYIRDPEGPFVIKITINNGRQEQRTFVLFPTDWRPAFVVRWRKL